MMLYDVFDLDRFEVEEKCNPYVTLFRVKMAQGVVEVPRIPRLRRNAAGEEVIAC